MNYKISKKIIAILLVLSMVIPTFVINVNAEDTDTTSKIDTCEIEWRDYPANEVKTYLEGENYYPTPDDLKDDYLFAGWYTAQQHDITYALKGKTPTDTTYALFIPKHVLSVKAQVSAHLRDGKIDDKDDTASIRFATTVASEFYKNVGFEVTYKIDNVDKEKIRESSTVYKKLYVTGTDKEWEETPEGLFCGVSKYFSAYTINKIPEAYYDMEFTIKPYWTTLDGDKVYGVTDTKTVAEGAKADITINNDGTNGTVI